MKHASTQISRKAPRGREGSVSATSHAKSVELIKLGVDTHGGQYVFSRMIDHQGVQPPQSLAPDQFMEFLKRQLSLARRAVLVYEAGPYGFALYRQASELGAECLVCAPERLSRGRKRVNDKIDARELLSRLDRYLAGNTAALRLVHPPTLQQEMSRREARERNTYRKERQRWMMRGRSLLHTLGISRPGRWWELDRWRQLMDLVRDRYGQTVPEQVRAELGRYLEALRWAGTKLDELTALLRQSARAKQQAGDEPQQPGKEQEIRKQSRDPQKRSEDPTGQSKAKGKKGVRYPSDKRVPDPLIHSQVRIKGIGELSSELLDREMVDWDRFKNRRQVASYTGLCPGEESSGDTQMKLSIDKHGNPRVRAVLVECAWLLPRFQPKYQALQRWKWVFEPSSKAGRALRKKAVVALGRKLAVDLWRIRTGRATPAELGLETMR